MRVLNFTHHIQTVSCPLICVLQDLPKPHRTRSMGCGMLPSIVSLAWWLECVCVQRSTFSNHIEPVLCGFDMRVLNLTNHIESVLCYLICVLQDLPKPHRTSSMGCGMLPSIVVVSLAWWLECVCVFNVQHSQTT